MEIWTTEGLPARQHFAYWREVICEAFAALDPRPLTQQGAHHPASFPSRVALCPLGEINGARIESNAQMVMRDFEQIRVDAQDRLFVNVQVRGVGRVSQGDRSSIVRPGCFSVVDTARPYTLRFDDRFEVLSFRVPRQLLLAKVHAPTQFFAREIDGNAGVGRMATGFMHNLVASADTLPAAAHDELAGQLCELVALAARMGQATNLSAEQSSLDRFVREARQYIDQSLVNPELSVTLIALRFGVSVRYVHKAFASSGTTAAAYVRSARLQRCGQDLLNPRDRRTIGAIANRWGFRDLPQFTRMFGAAFACTPSQFRKGAKNIKTSINHDIARA